MKCIREIILYSRENFQNVTQINMTNKIDKVIILLPLSL